MLASHRVNSKGFVVSLSDDDLVPYAMDFDPDSSKPLPPRYLRTLLQGTWYSERL